MPEQEQKNGNASKPENCYALNTGEWAHWIHQQFPEFEWVSHIAAMHIVSILDGMRWMHRKLLQRGLHYEYPQFCILHKDEQVIENNIGYDPTSNLVHIKKSLLREYAARDPESIKNLVHSDTGESIFTGRVSDFFFLVGVEECHHSIFTWLKGKQESSNHALSMAEYDAKEIEFRALRWQLRAALEHAMPTYTVDVLRNRIERARKVRHAREEILTPST